MEELLVLGTGNALATKCYNTCFAVRSGEELLLVDAGGGNGILKVFEDMEIDAAHIHHMIVTHEHCDHVLGVVWVIRKIATMMKKGNYSGDFHIYCHARLAEPIQTICKYTLQKKFTDLFGKQIHFVPVKDGEKKEAAGYLITFFDIHSTKAEQYGFTLNLQNGKKFTCLGDEPYNEQCEQYVSGSDWLLSEAFCLYGEREKFQPYEKHHSTVKDACELAERLHVKNLILWHTEDKNYEDRKRLYTAEGAAYFHGNLFVPYDREILSLS